MIKYGDKLRVGVLQGYTAPQAKLPGAFGDCIPYADPMWYLARCWPSGFRLQRLARGE
jgi:hypothetical protein